MAEAKSGAARVVAAMVKNKQTLDLALGKQVAGVIAKSFGVKLEEVAILRLLPAENLLEFVVPETLARVGTIPLSSTTSLAVRTVRDARAEFLNSFSGARHHTVFEAVRLSDEQGEPIQKIMSVPVRAGDKVVGAIQVSRKGTTPAASGADFTRKNLAALEEVAAVLAQCFPPS